MPRTVDVDRRRFLSAAVAIVALPDVVVNKSLSVQSAGGTPLSTTKDTVRAGDSLGALKQVVAGVLNVGYADAGPTNGRPVLLLHGWPYDIHSFIDVVPLLASAGYRVIVPYLRGYGTTRFLSSAALRNGQHSALALDGIALMDALGIDKAVVAGFDWGARTANIMAVLWPERCKGIVAVSGYLIGNREANRQPLTPQAEYAWWYQYYFATERGERGYSEYRRDFGELIWRLASPKWQFEVIRSEEHTSELQSPCNLVCRLL